MGFYPFNGYKEENLDEAGSEMLYRILGAITGFVLLICLIAQFPLNIDFPLQTELDTFTGVK